MENNINNISKYTKKRGFTLVELLATISLLSIISVIVLYTSTSIIGNTNNRIYMVTINNIQKEASTYVLENNKNIFWLSYDSNYLYQCITVQNLIDMGYFDNTILNSKIGEDRKILPNDYIYVEKDKNTNVITKNILLYGANSEYSSLCGDYVNVKGDILFDVPIGWAKSKEVTITYKLDSSLGDASNYSYGYTFKDEVSEKFKFDNVRNVTKSINITDNGILHAYIVKKDGGPLVTDSIEITEIDNQAPTSPIISLNAEGNIVLSGSQDNVTSVENIVYKASLSDSNFSSSFVVPSSTSTIYAVAVDEFGNVSGSSSKEYVVENTQNGTVKLETVFVGYQCVRDGKIYSTESEANEACKYIDTKSPESDTTYYCKTGDYNSSTGKCDITGTATKYYYCSNTGQYQTGSLCATKYNQKSCGSWSSVANGNCSFSCGKSFAGTWAHCSGNASCSGSFSCTATCTSEQIAAGCRNGVIIGGSNCTSSKLYTCKLYGSLKYYCDVTGEYNSTSHCKKSVNLSSKTTYSCPSGYSTNDSNLTSSSVCRKTRVDTITEVARSYYSCSLFSSNEYNTEDLARTSCTNYCSNSLTKYYSNKNKCIGLD